MASVGRLEALEAGPVRLLARSAKGTLSVGVMQAGVGVFQ